MFFANSYFGSKKIADIRNGAKRKFFSSGVYMKTVFSLMLCVVATVTAVMVGYVILSLIDACGLLDGVGYAVWLTLEFLNYALVILFVALPLGCGWVRFLYVLTLDGGASVADCFYYFKSIKTYARAFSFVFWFALKLFSVIALCEATRRQQTYFLNRFDDMGYYLIGAGISLLLLVALVLLLTLAVFLMGRGFCSLAIFVKDDEISPRMAKKKARALSKGKMGKIFRYKLAYLPQMAFVVVTVLIYGGVYFAQLYTCAYFDAVDELVTIHNTDLKI